MAGNAFFISAFDLPGILTDLAAVGAVSVPLLTDAATQALHQAAASCDYTLEQSVYGTRDRRVKTDYGSFELTAETGLLAEFQQAFQALLDRSLAQLETDPFSTPFCWNAAVLQRYTPGQLGITPHRDSLWAINLIALINLGGQAEFYRCDDRQGTGAVQLDTTPGNVIFLRAPGFLNSQVRPFHFLTNIRSTRYSLGLRQRSEPGRQV
ncbi:MAG: hypothetical protein ICV62_16775 [Cyanobacteria bacterium Co-bin13]|nr:hypothetical protein [Cyanobacteria bacterium Co-bin13]